MISNARVSNVSRFSSHSKLHTRFFALARVGNNITNFSGVSHVLTCKTTFATIHHEWDICVQTSRITRTAAASVLAYLACEAIASHGAVTAFAHSIHHTCICAGWGGGAFSRSTRVSAGGGGDVTTDAIDNALWAKIVLRWERIVNVIVIGYFFSILRWLSFGWLSFGWLSFGWLSFGWLSFGFASSILKHPLVVADDESDASWG